jgi:hypothetical protein
MEEKYSLHGSQEVKRKREGGSRKDSTLNEL